MKKVDILFAMGTSLLEGAKLKIPTAICPLNSMCTISEENKLLYFFHSKNFQIIDEIYWQDYATQENDRKTFEEVMSDIYSLGRKQEIGELCYKKFATDFSLEKVGEKLVKLFEKTNFDFEKYQDLKLGNKFKSKYKINKYPLLFLSSIPNPEESEGMMQRIVAIDNTFKNYPRLYISETKNRSVKSFRIITALLLLPFYNLLNLKSKLTSKIKKTRNNDELFECVFNSKSVVEVCGLIKLLIKANKIYAHSIYNARKFINILSILKKRIVVDIHGIVPEEVLFFKGNKSAFKSFNKVEKRIFKIADILVCVTNKMKDFYLVKYNFLSPKQFLTIPIFDNKITKNSQKNNIKETNLIYAGGLQKWQNIDQMIGAIKFLPKYFSYIFLVPEHDLHEFEEKISNQNIDTKNIEIKSVPKSQIYDYYDKSVFGFILRDDMPINNVACPTKLIEYLSNGVIPIVLTPNIGDFSELGYQYVSLQDLIAGREFDSKQIEKMREVNYLVCKKLQEIKEINLKKLNNILKQVAK